MAFLALLLVHLVRKPFGDQGRLTRCKCGWRFPLQRIRKSPPLYGAPGRRVRVGESAAAMCKCGDRYSDGSLFPAVRPSFCIPVTSCLSWTKYEECNAFLIKFYFVKLERIPLPPLHFVGLYIFLNTQTFKTCLWLFPIFCYILTWHEHF